MSDIQDTQAPADWTSRIDGLLGGPPDSMVSPYVGREGLSNARNNALLNFGIGLMQSSGWHPYRVTMAQALAQGLQNAQQGYQSSIDTSMKGVTASQALALGRLNYARQALMLRGALTDPDIRESLGLDAGQNTPAAPADDGSGAQSFPVPANNPASSPIGLPPIPGIPSTIANPFAGGAQAPQAAGAGSPVSAAGLSTGNPMAAPQTGAIGPARLAQIKSAYARLKLTGMLDPTNGRGVAAALEPFLPDVKIGSNGTAYDAKDIANIGRNFASVFDNKATIGPDGSVSLRPGVPRVEAQLADAAERAKAGYNFNVPTVMPNGAPGVQTPVQALGFPGPGAASAPGSGQPPLPQGAPPLLPQAPAAPAPQAAPQAPGGPVQTGLSPSQKIYMEGGAKNLQTTLDTATAAVKDAPQQLQILYRNDQLLRQSGADAGAPATLAIGKYLQAMGLLSAKDSQNTDKIQELYNNEATAVMGQLKTMFPGRITNADLQFAVSTMAGKGQSAQAARVLNGITAAKTMQAMDYQKFVSAFQQKAAAGQVDPNTLGQAWLAHEAQQPSIWETPLLLNSGALTQRTNKQGAMFVDIPGRGWLPVARTPSGMIAPLNQGD